MGRKTYKQASKRAQMRDKMEGFEPGGQSFEDFDMEDALPVAERIAGEFVKRVQANIVDAGLKVSGKMADLSVEVGEDGQTVNISAYPHLIYHDLGVNGTEFKGYNTPFSYKDKMPPVDTIREWVAEKGLQSRDSAKFGDKPMNIGDGAAWGIAKKIQKEGIKPKNIYSKEIPALTDQLAEELGNVAISSVFKMLNGE